jgi:outer membrane protein assembly factor BamB
MSAEHDGDAGAASDGRLYIGSMAGPVRVVDPATLNVVDTYDAPAMATHNNLVVTDDGLLVGGGDTNLVAIETESATVRWTADITVPGDPSPCPFLAVSEPVGRLYCGDSAGVLQERELTSGDRTGVRLDPQLGSVGDLAIAANGSELVAFGGDTAVVSRWRLDGSGPIVDAYRPGWGTSGYDPSGRLMIVFEGERTSLQDTVVAPPESAVWDPASDEIVDELDDIVAGLWATPSVVAAMFADGTVGFYDVGAHTRVDGPPEREVVVHYARLSAGGTRIYVEGHFDDGTDDRCEVWSIDAATQRYIGPVIDVGPCPPPGSVYMSASADASRLAFTYPVPDGWATDIYDGRTGEKLGGPLHGQFTAVIAPDGTLFGGDLAGNVTQYDLETLEPIGTFPRARGRIGNLEFSADGELLLVGSANQTLTVYDVATRSQLGDPIDTGRPIVEGNAGPVLRPDGKTLAVNGRDGLAIWNLEPDRLADAACDVAGRNLTQAEWDAYLNDLGDYRVTCPDDA